MSTFKYNSTHESTNNAFAAGFQTAQEVYFGLPWYKRLMKQELGRISLKEIGQKSTVSWWKK